jgi:hypothetical protein
VAHLQKVKVLTANLPTQIVVKEAKVETVAKEGKADNHLVIKEVKVGHHLANLAKVVNHLGRVVHLVKETKGDQVVKVVKEICHHHQMELI